MLWSYFLVPETKGRSLEDMDAVFKDRTAHEDKVRRREIVAELKRSDARNVAVA